MEFTKTENEKEIILNFVGRVDTTNAGEFEETILKEIKTDMQTVADFSGIDYISSAGLRALLSSHKQAMKCGGTFIVRHVNSDVMEVLDITGFSSILTVED